MQQNKLAYYFSSIVLLLLLGTTTPHAFAQNQGETHTVKAGETLFSIARQYDIGVDQLRAWNDLESNELSIGQSLIVGKQGTSTDENTTIHEVQPQETLFSLSKKYGVSIAEIKTWNNLEDNSLETGQQLIIHEPDQQASGSGKTGSLVVNTTVSSNTYYTVKSGDTLFEIARQHNMTVQELKELNDLTNNTIRVGQQLTVKETRSAPSISENMAESSPQGEFVNYTLKKQQSQQQILNQFNMDEAEFRALNPDLSSTTFRSGQKITVLAPPSKSYKNPYTIKGSLKDLGETTVSVYENSQSGTTTTSGELYNPDQLTAAHSNISLGNVIYIQNPRNNKGIYVRINDRFSGNGLKLSRAAFESLGLASASNATVNIYQDQ